MKLSDIIELSDSWDDIPRIPENHGINLKWNDGRWTATISSPDYSVTSWGKNEFRIDEITGKIATATNRNQNIALLAAWTRFNEPH